MKLSIFLVCLSIASISCEWLTKNPSLEQIKSLDGERGLEQQQQQQVQERRPQPAKAEILSKLSMQTKDQELLDKIEQFLDAKNQTQTQSRQKRQLSWAGGMGHGFGAYDYNDYYGDYASDYAYDYYDWVCTEHSCQLCDILTSECCNPANDVNCFLPDSCLNNPCLSGGTCITTKSIDNRPDFICVCLPGLTGKYCQLFNDYFVGTDIVHPIYPPILPPAIPPAQPIAVMDYTRPVYPPSFPPPAPVEPVYQEQPYQAPVQQAAPVYQAAPVQQAAPAYQAAPVQQVQQDFQPQQQSSYSNQQVRTLGAKSVPCEGKKIYSAASGGCVDFALKKM